MQVQRKKDLENRLKLREEIKRVQLTSTLTSQNKLSKTQQNNNAELIEELQNTLIKAMNTKRMAGLPNTLLPEEGFISADPDFFNVKHARAEAAYLDLGINDSARSTVSHGDMSAVNLVEAH